MTREIVFFVATYLYIYLIAWWTVLFVVLPLGVQSYYGAGLEVPGGGDPGAPVAPNLKRKFLTTSWIAAALTFAAWVVLSLHIVKPPPPPS